MVTWTYSHIIQYLTVPLSFNLYIIYRININNLFEIFSLLNHIKILLPKLACPNANRQPSTPDTTPWIDSINALLATSLWTSSSVKRPSKANIFGAAGKLSWKIKLNIQNTDQNTWNFNLLDQNWTMYVKRIQISTVYLWP